MTRTPPHPPGAQPARASRLALLLLVFSLALPVHAQQAGLGVSENIVIEEGGAIWIEGTASVVDYTCRAQELAGAAAIEISPRPQDNAGGEGGVALITVSFPVRTLHCGKKAMNRDMYEALKAEQYPLIRYRLLEAGLADTLDGDEGMAGKEAGTWFSIRTRGVLTIAGVSDTTEVTVRGMPLDNSRFRVKGSRELNMDSFNVTPPSALMGLIRADKHLTVHFDVTVRLRDEEG